MEQNLVIEKIRKEDYKISVALMAIFVILTIQYFILIYFDLLQSGNASQVQTISKILVGITFLYAFPAVYHRSKIKGIKIYFFSSFIFLINYFIFPDNREILIGILLPFFTINLPAFIYSLSIKNVYVLKNMMFNSSLIVFFVGSIITTLVLNGRVNVGTYSMTLSYYMLLPNVVFLNELFDKFTIRNFLFSISSILIILLLGSRGALLCIGVFTLLKIIKNRKMKSFKSIYTHITLITFLVSVIIFFEQIISALYKWFLELGINSRTLVLLMNENVHLSGRDDIYQLVTNEISYSPILGLGLGGDTRVIGHSYVHNFFIEILANFGVVTGALLIVIFLILVFKSLKTTDYEKYSFITMWLGIGFIHLLVSSTYVTDFRFGIFLGLLINLNSHRN